MARHRNNGLPDQEKEYPAKQSHQEDDDTVEKYTTGKNIVDNTLI